MINPAIINAFRDIVGRAGLIDDAVAMKAYMEDIRGYARGRVGLVVMPRSTEEVADVVKLCARSGLGIIPQGGNTGLCGGAITDDPGVVAVNLKRMHRIFPPDSSTCTMIVEAGAVLEAVQTAAREAGFSFPLSLGSQGSCQIGGNAATNAGGHSVIRYGSTRALILGVEVVLADGRVWNGLRVLPKDNTGYDLKDLFLGAEGTLGIITRLVLRLVPGPHRTETALVAVPDLSAAITLLGTTRALTAGLVSAFEYMTARAVALGAKHVPGVRNPFGSEHEHLVLIEVDRPTALPDVVMLLEPILAEAMENGLVADAIIAASEAQRASLWRIREAIVEGIRGEGGSIAHDISLPLGSLEGFLAAANKRVEEVAPGVRPVYFGHLGDGNIHYNLCGPAGGDSSAFKARREEINMIVFDITHNAGGSFSAEHGIGRLRIGEMARYKNKVELDLMRAVKDAVDPHDVMNPGAVLPR